MVHSSRRIAAMALALGMWGNLGWWVNAGPGSGTCGGPQGNVRGSQLLRRDAARADLGPHRALLRPVASRRAGHHGAGVPGLPRQRGDAAFPRRPHPAQRRWPVPRLRRERRPGGIEAVDPVYPWNSSLHRAIERIRSLYKRDFHQQSVLRVDETSCISF